MMSKILHFLKVIQDENRQSGNYEGNPSSDTVAKPEVAPMVATTPDDNEFHKALEASNKSFCKEKTYFGITVPEGWIVIEMGQSLAHCLWYCQLVNFDDLTNHSGDDWSKSNVRRVWTEEHDTPSEALGAAVQLVKAHKYVDN